MTTIQRVNPFEMAQAQFDHAAEILDLDAATDGGLSTPDQRSAARGFRNEGVVMLPLLFLSLQPGAVSPALPPADGVNNIHPPVSRPRSGP